MIEIRYVEAEDKEFWYGLDKHLPELEFVLRIFHYVSLPLRSKKSA